MPDLSRRRALRGLGVCIALPYLESLPTRGAERGEPDDVAKRFVCVSPNYGMHPDGFFPDEVGTRYEMPAVLSPLGPHRDDVTIFSNLDHPGVGGGHGCSNTFLNGVELKDVRQEPTRLQSLDQFLAERIGRQTRFPSLLLGSGGVSWSRAGVKLPTDGDPRRVFTRLFTDDPPNVRERTRRVLREDASILDVVREDARRLSGRLARADRDKLDQYLGAIREVERRLTRRTDWIDVPKPKVSDGVIRGNDEATVDLAYPYNTAVMYDMLVLALQTNSTNVVCYGHPGGNRLFPFEGITLGYHSLTHHGRRPELMRELAIIETFYSEQFSRFLTKLKETPDAEGRSLFDSTVVLFGSGMGNASAHSSRNLPILVAGGGLKHGHHHRFERTGRDGRPVSDLFVTLLQRLGVEVDAFATSTGNLNHLLT